MLNQEDEQQQQLSPSLNPTTPPSASGENNMLLKLLNDRSSQDHTESRRGTELLQQLLNSQDNQPEQHSSHLSSETLRGLKRTAHEMMMMELPPRQGPSKAGELCKRNPRLVSLLAKPSEQSVTIPQVRNLRTFVILFRLKSVVNNNRLLICV